MYFSGVLTHHNPYVINFEIISEKVGNDDHDWFGKENQHNEQHHIRHQHRAKHFLQLLRNNNHISPDPRVRYLAPKLAELHLGAAGPAAEPSHRTCNPFRLEQRNRSLYMDEKILRLASKLSRYRKNSSLQQVSCVVHADE